MPEILSERAQELQALQAIYPEELVIESENAAVMDLRIVLHAARQIRCVPRTQSILPSTIHPGARKQNENISKIQNSSQDIPTTEEDHDREAIISHLPPIRISFSLPERYPSEHSPIATITASMPWLPVPIVHNLEAMVEPLWEEYGRSEILYAYISQVQEAAESAFGLDYLEVPSEILPLLLDFDRTSRRDEFEKGTYDCGICLDPKSGKDCHQMTECGHIFCNSCLQVGYGNAIALGNVNEVTCMEPDCSNEGMGAKARYIKSRRLLGPRELLDLGLPRAAVQRWVNLIRKKKLESDRSTVWCPLVTHCHGAARGNKYPMPDVPLEEIDLTIWNLSHDSSDSSTPEGTKQLSQLEKLKPHERLAICEDCGHSFCKVCAKTWHGDLIWCYEERNEEEVSAEEKASLAAIAMSTSPCPTCNIPVSKTEACNHMICSECETHFCYLCSAPLDRTYVYGHYNDPSKPCYQRLWVLSTGGSEDDVEFQGVRGAEIVAQRQQEEERRRRADEDLQRRRAEFEKRMSVRRKAA